MSFAVTSLTGFGARRAVVSGGGAWSTTLKNSHITLSNSDRRATGTSIVSAATALGGTVRSSGKGYAEITLTTKTTNNIVGFATASATTADGGRPGFEDSQGWGFYTGSGATIWSSTAGGGTGGSAAAQGDIIGLAYDAASGKIWWAVNNTWLHSGNPGSGTNEETNNPGAGAALYLFCTVRADNDACDINTGQAAFTYTPPSGFSAWG